MRCTTSPRGLSDLKTASTGHIHCRPRPEGTTHLELFLLSKEKERFEKKQMMLGHQLRAIRERVNDIDKTMAKLERRNEAECITDAGDNPDRNGKKLVEGKWKKMSLRY